MGGHEYIGARVRKYFPGHGWYRGVVEEFVVLSRKKYYKVEYEDGDTEEVTVEELVKILDTPEERPKEKATKKKKCGPSRRPARKVHVLATKQDAGKNRRRKKDFEKYATAQGVSKATVGLPPNLPRVTKSLFRPRKRNARSMSSDGEYLRVMSTEGVGSEDGTSEAESEELVSVTSPEDMTVPRRKRSAAGMRVVNGFSGFRIKRLPWKAATYLNDDRKKRSAGQSPQAQAREKRARIAADFHDRILSVPGMSNLDELEQMAASALAASCRRKTMGFGPQAQPFTTSESPDFCDKGTSQRKVRSLKEIMRSNQAPKSESSAGTTVGSGLITRQKSTLSPVGHTVQAMTMQKANRADWKIASSTNGRASVPSATKETSKQAGRASRSESHQGPCCPSNTVKAGLKTQCPIIVGMVKEGLVRMGDRVEYRSPPEQTLAEGWLTGNGIVCGRCGRVVTCSDFGRCAGKEGGGVGKEIYLPSGENLDDVLVRFLGQGCLTAEPIPSIIIKPTPVFAKQGADPDYDRTIDMLLGGI
ncbi:hypothetical protein BSKO_04820 [Bryopsis sp. KO-2023]|nr:hypothetical protein BSKO_04820 [Bryopsis sp. KO-2023]